MSKNDDFEPLDLSLLDQPSVSKSTPVSAPPAAGPAPGDLDFSALPNQANCLRFSGTNKLKVDATTPLELFTRYLLASSCILLVIILAAPFFLAQPSRLGERQIGSSGSSSGGYRRGEGAKRIAEGIGAYSDYAKSTDDLLDSMEGDERTKEERAADRGKTMRERNKVLLPAAVVFFMFCLILKLKTDVYYVLDGYRRQILVHRSILGFQSSTPVKPFAAMSAATVNGRYHPGSRYKPGWWSYCMVIVLRSGKIMRVSDWQRDAYSLCVGEAQKIADFMRIPMVPGQPERCLRVKPARPGQQARIEHIGRFKSIFTNPMPYLVYIILLLLLFSLYALFLKPDM